MKFENLFPCKKQLFDPDKAQCLTLFMECDDRLLLEFFVRDLLGEKYYHAADRFHDSAFTKQTTMKCITKLRKMVDQLECDERLRLSIHKYLDHVVRTVKKIKNAETCVPLMYCLAAVWNLLGGLGRIRYWVPEYTQDVDRYLNQKEFLDRTETMYEAHKKLQKTVHETQLDLLKQLRKGKRTIMEISEIMSLPEGRIRKMLNNL